MFVFVRDIVNCGMTYLNCIYFARCCYLNCLSCILKMLSWQVQTLTVSQDPRHVDSEVMTDMTLTASIGLGSARWRSTQKNRMNA